jgi:hypothetical protein
MTLYQVLILVGTRNPLQPSGMKRVLIQVMRLLIRLVIGEPCGMATILVVGLIVDGYVMGTPTALLRMSPVFRLIRQVQVSLLHRLQVGCQGNSCI